MIQAIGDLGQWLIRRKANEVEDRRTFVSSSLIGS
jgi:hypothetical protein